jgi:hypothetical protein
LLSNGSCGLLSAFGSLFDLFLVGVASQTSGGYHLSLFTVLGNRIEEHDLGGGVTISSVATVVGTSL